MENLSGNHRFKKRTKKYNSIGNNKLTGLFERITNNTEAGSFNKTYVFLFPEIDNIITMILCESFAQIINGKNH